MYSLFESIFAEGDPQPKRHMYYRIGSITADGVTPPTPHFNQISIVLLEVDGVVHATICYNMNACHKYEEEISDIIFRSHSLFKYTEDAMTVFTDCGAIVQ